MLTWMLACTCEVGSWGGGLYCRYAESFLLTTALVPLGLGGRRAERVALLCLGDRRVRLRTRWACGGDVSSRIELETHHQPTEPNPPRDTAHHAPPNPPHATFSLPPITAPPPTSLTGSVTTIHHSANPHATHLT